MEDIYPSFRPIEAQKDPLGMYAVKALRRPNVITGTIGTPCCNASLTTPFRAFRNITHSSSLIDSVEETFSFEYVATRSVNLLVDESNLLNTSWADDRTFLVRNCPDNVLLVYWHGFHPCVYMFHQRHFKA